MSVNVEIDKFYNENQDEIETAFLEYVSGTDWGSGEDIIKITDDIFWEFVEDYKDRYYA